VGAHLAQTIARRQANELGCLFQLQGVCAVTLGDSLIYVSSAA
jgi:hypothetical protein